MDKKLKGQFFTTSYISTFMVKLIAPKDNDIIIDPACGDGQFLYDINQMNKNIELFGCEIDINVKRKCEERVPSANIFLHNGLYSESLSNGEENIGNIIKENSYDVVIANPPFNGLTNKITKKEILNNFELAKNKNSFRNSQSIEILFIERFIKLLKPQGRLCTILPEGIFSDERLYYVRDWIYERFTIEAMICLPKRGTFETANVNSVIFCGHKKPWNSEEVFYVRDIAIEDLDIIYNYMIRNNIFIKS